MNITPVSSPPILQVKPPDSGEEQKDDGSGSEQKEVQMLLQHRGILSPQKMSIYEEVCSELESGTWTNKYQTVMAGDTAVYLPEAHPEIVIKRSGSQCEFRINKMQQATKFMVENKIQSLVIPEVVNVKKFLIEERLPVSDKASHNVSVYLSNLELFEPVVKDMVLFCRKFHLQDLVLEVGQAPRNQRLYLNPQIENIVRWDNLPLYTSTENEIKVAKIGLIDLEHLHDKPNTKKSLTELVRIFPYHCELIIKEAEALGLTFDANALNKSHREGLLYLQSFYIDHASFIKCIGVKNSTADWLFFSDPRIFSKLEPVVEAELLQLNQGHNEIYKMRKIKWPPPKDFLQESIKHEDIQLIAKNIVGRILANIVDEIDKFINQAKVNTNFNFSELTEPDKVFLRSVAFHNAPATKNLISIISPILNDAKIDYENRSRAKEFIAEQLIHRVMTELVEIGELLSYNKSNTDTFVVIRF